MGNESTKEWIARKRRERVGKKLEDKKVEKK